MKTQLRVNYAGLKYSKLLMLFTEKIYILIKSIELPTALSVIGTLIINILPNLGSWHLLKSKKALIEYYLVPNINNFNFKTI